MSSPKSCVIGSGLGPGVGPNLENQDGEEEPVVMVAPPTSQRAFSTLPSVDSAVESWDGSNMDSSFTTPGRDRPLTSADLINASVMKHFSFAGVCSSYFSVVTVQFPRVAQRQDKQQPIIIFHSPESQSTVGSGSE